MAKLTKAEMDAFKKKNFNLKVKVTEAQLDKLRAAGTPTAAIAKYKNDPAMREALNRFYGKARVTAATGSASSPVSSTATKVPTRGGPGAKVPPRPAGGPGAKTGKDGRSPTAVKKSSGVSTANKVGIAAAVAALAAGAERNRRITAKSKTKAKHAMVAVTKTAKTVGKHKAVKVATKTAKTVGKHKAVKVATKVAGKTPIGRRVTLALMATDIKKSASKTKAPGGKHSNTKLPKQG